MPYILLVKHKSTDLKLNVSHVSHIVLPRHLKLPSYILLLIRATITISVFIIDTFIFSFYFVFIEAELQIIFQRLLLSLGLLRL